jgi:putative ABC transport system substrate-binding protein
MEDGIQPSPSRAARPRLRPSKRWSTPVFALALAAADAALAQRVFVLSSSDAPAYQQALAGIRIGIGSLPFDIQQLTPDNNDAMQRLLVDAGRDVALVMLGTRAGELAARAAPSASVISCMAPSADAVRGLPNAIAVPIDIPIDLQIAWLGKLLPAARTIGLPFDPAINLRRMESLAPALARAGYTPLLAPVTSPAMLPSALSRLRTTAEALLAIPDPTVYTQQASKALLVFSFRNRIPLIGLTEAWVKAGALYALDWDYLYRWAEQLSVSDLLAQLRGAASPSTPGSGS